MAREGSRCDWQLVITRELGALETAFSRATMARQLIERPSDAPWLGALRRPARDFDLFTVEGHQQDRQVMVLRIPAYVCGYARHARAVDLEFPILASDRDSGLWIYQYWKN